jgi:squalene-hopene/tetraprenyl-beta-curcumene cyclase
LQSQRHEVHPFTQSPPGGWGWSDAAGAVPDADDTAAALLALKVLSGSGGTAYRGQFDGAAGRAVAWLVDLQNGDGGWPTFCRGWGALPFDRSGCDLTAHAIRALHAWKHIDPDPRVGEAIERGLAYLAGRQRPDGSWVPLWFGNQYFPGEENPIYGTARVLLAYRDLDLMASPPAQRGVAWLAAHTDPGGGWGGGPGGDSAGGGPTVEETALAIEALLAAPGGSAVDTALKEGLDWLVAAVNSGKHRESAPIGFYFAKLWYYEKLYPLVFTVAALGQAIRRFPPA